MIWNIPNVLTLSRALVVPIILYFFQQQRFFWGVTLLIYCVLSDFFDGFLARKLNQCTSLGALLDPIVDKFVALSFYGFFMVNNMLPFWFTSIIIIRNLSQLLSVPILMWWLKKDFQVRPKLFSRIGTAISDLYIFIPFLRPSFSEFINSSLMLGICFFEVIILLTYLPRLYAIAKGSHDTFE